MKRTKIIYWIITGLFSAAMLLSAIPDIANTPEARTFIANLGYPNYIVPFLGVAKLLGVIAVLIPGFPRIREWAYAGLFFDLFGAAYSQLAQDGWHPQILFMLVPIGLLFLSYYFWHKKINAV